ncbi:MAG: thymidine phosphorylase [Gemmatimonadaceae bacterium]|jgi:pyrimidine-nucleoside phosphorylase|nr:thymidine phosphorylase [Gemmatimonadaceae bacterium]
MILRDLIERKRDGGRLSADEWHFVAHVAADRSAPDYQLAALLMAIYFRGLDDAETRALTRAMLGSGRTLARPAGAGAWIDKHSTGGVGDKTSLVLAPLLAACGVTVPMMSGRGLGHTGGTLDKLESIPGFRTGLSLEEAQRQLATLGCALIGQTGEIAPADRTLYALRDATATVECIPLIAASIMSKKLAEGLTGLVLDVKRGSGAFLPELERGLALARTMVDIGHGAGVEVVALVTAMDRPLGQACGNALELRECLDVLHGAGPADLWTVTEALAIEMLRLARPSLDVPTARAELGAAITSGAALARFRTIVAAQGGDVRVLDDPARLPTAPVLGDLVAPRDGIVTGIAPRPVGHAIIALGGGRTRAEDAVDPAVGVVFRVRVGDTVRAGEPLAVIHARTHDALADARARLQAAITIDEALVAPPLPWVTHRITTAGVAAL